MLRLLAEFISQHQQKSGAVAQLGARVNGIHEVAGSIPASSTKTQNVGLRRFSIDNHTTKRMTIGAFC